MPFKNLAGLLLLLIAGTAAAQPARDLTVLSTWPKGQTEALNQSQTILVTFSKPMVPIQELPEGDGAGPVSISPAVKGKFRWLGTSTLSYTPSQPFEIATEFKASIKAGTKALDGSVLAQDVNWSFTTPRPALTVTRPGHNSKSVDIKTAVLLQFNQQIDAAKAGSSIKMFEGKRNGTETAFTIGYPTQEDLKKMKLFAADSLQVLMLRPKANLNKNTKYVVLVNPGLMGTRGSLGMAKEASFSFTTYQSFTFAGVTNPTDRDPRSGLTLRFSNPVVISDVIKHITFAPMLALPDNYDEWNWSTTDPEIQYKMSPQTKYTGTIRKDLTDIFGQRLGQDVQFTVNTVSYKPGLTMTTGHGILEAYGERMYPVSVVNVAAAQVQMLALTPENVVPTLRSDTIYQGNNKLNIKFDIDKKWEPKAKRDVQTVAGLKVDDALPASKHGAVLLQVARSGNDRDETEYEFYHRADVQVTDMGLSAKFSPETILIWVTTLKDAKAVRNANVQIRSDSNTVLWQGKTNDEGFSQAPGWGSFDGLARSEWSSPRLWVLVTNGDDFAYTASNWQEGIEPYRFSISTDWNPQIEPWQGAIATDRGLYRPGEEVSFKGIFRARKAGDWVVASGDVVFHVYDSHNEIVHADSGKLNEFGSLASSYKIPKDAGLGYYRIEGNLRRKKSDAKSREPYVTVGTETFRVEAFRVSEFDVTAKTQEQSYIAGDAVKGSFEARYLFGAVMKNDKVQWRLRFDPSSYTPEGWSEYAFGKTDWFFDYAAGPQSKLLFKKDTVLNAKGILDVEAKTQVGDIRASGKLVLEADVTSPSRQTISGRATVPFHPGEFYAGIQLSTTFTQKDSTLSYKIVTVTPEGKVVSGKNIEVKVLKREWHSVRKASAQGGFAWESEAVDTLLQTVQVVSGSQPIVQTFRPGKSGLYVIQAGGKDARGNEISSDTYFYASGSDYVAWDRGNDDRIELIADAKKYKPGQTARIIIKNPYEEAAALVTVEREGIQKYWRTTLKGSAPEIAIPITDKSLPNVFVSVLLLQGRMTKKPELDQMTDVGRPSFKMGYIELTVDPGTRHLVLSAAPDKETYRPGDSVTVHLTAKDAAGSPALVEVAVSVADKGVLNLIGYKLHDPFDMFYGPRPLSVVTTESRAQIVQARSFGEKGEDEGGGGGVDLAGIDLRGNFKSTAYWNAYLKTDSAGTLTFKFKLPDNLTTFKIMCAGQTKKSEFGYGEHSFIVNKPLLLQASLPRFARVGDKFEAGVVVHNNSTESGTVTLRTTAEGIAFKGKEVLEFALASGESKEIRQAFEVQQTGKAVFTFQAKLGKETDGLTIGVPMLVPRRKETVADYRAIDTTTSQTLIVPKNSAEGLGSVEFTASSTALSGLESSVDYLFTYPYGCLEQKCSAILPIILGREMVEAFGLQALKGKDAKAVVGATLAELRKFQIWNGGFSYWPGDSYESPYASAYAMYVLAQAKKAGYKVNSQMCNRGLEYIKEVLRWQDNKPGYPYRGLAWSGTKTLILYTLALAGKPEPGYYENYFKTLDRLSLFSRATLMKAIAISTKNKKMVQSIATNLLNNIKVNPTSAHFEEPNMSGLEWCWSSNTRTTGIILQALLEADAFPTNKADMPAKIVKWLMDQKKTGRWNNTQENVYVVDALAAYYRKFEKETPKFKAEIVVAAQTILSSVFEGRSLKTEKVVKELNAFEAGKELPVAMKKDGTGMLYAGIRMSYYPTDPPKPAEEGIAVTKTVEPLNPDGWTGGKTFAAGSLIKVTLRVITPQQRNFVVVEDPLPAGFEAVNTSFETESTELGAVVEQAGDENEQQHWWGTFNHHELRDDRVMLFGDQLEPGVHTFTYLARATTYGTFTMPATYTEMMYEPEVFGNTGAAQVLVK